ncbi:MAG TPA: valine--tRNA ligase [Candidatus Paceibacterota bacterium]|nr:valine--tRNA ligase [Candidatus Paceibacterota bacterium]
MPEKFLKPYDPASAEPEIYKKWAESGFFSPENLPNLPDGSPRTEPYTIIMPPPNANGSLHAGHAVFVTIEDLLIRYNRMRGKKALWLPGADHAGFETQVVYEKKLEKEGRTRFGMDPGVLRNEILQFTMSNKSFMEGQLRQLGASCDWNREKFTLEPDIIRTVYGTFKQLYADGLAYRGSRIVNWCSKHQTSLSNLETEREERTDPFYYFKYGPFTIGTVRPETKFDDKYVVMHPDDQRYAQYKEGDKIELEWINGPLVATVIKDEASDPEMGSGVMTITPWHSGVDFDIAKRHGLDIEQIIDERGKLLPIAGEFAGMSIKDARPLIVEKLQSKGLLEKVDEKYIHEVPVCYKCGREIEPQVKEQWFVKTKPLAQRAIEVIENGEVKILTESHHKILMHWLHTIEDWNVSRQVIWGIPIPAWYKGNDIFVGEEAPGDGWTRDSDTFDTWFSSGQWPFATLGYPDGKDFAEFYPTQVMETGADIIFFWVARMLMLGLYRTGKVPFKEVYLHGMVRDAKGKKMSKSKGNVVSPLELSEQYGTDALRMGLIIGNTPGTDVNLDPNKIGAYKKFANKLWNITRFVLENTQNVTPEKTPHLIEADKMLLQEFTDMAKNITTDIDNYRFYLAGEKLYHYIWDRFASTILEESKEVFKGQDEAAINSRKQFLLYTLRTSLVLLHPFMPFITEEIWSSVQTGNLLIVEPWPSL